MRGYLSRLKIWVLLGALALTGCEGVDKADHPSNSALSAIGLYTSLPIAWNESSDIGEMLADPSAPHWALGELRRYGPVKLLDTLADASQHLALPQNGVLLLAQPRPLTPQENVALDNWVRAGGRVLMFIDPMLTAESAFSLGDPRRPQDIAMLSPILRRWGLELTFDEAQPYGDRLIDVAGLKIPINLAGGFQLLGNFGDGQASSDSGKSGGVAGVCRLEGKAFIADCIIGNGRVLAVADASIFENKDNFMSMAQRAAILCGLMLKMDLKKTGRSCNSE